MAVPTTTKKVPYTCNGSTGPYPITFSITSDADGNATNLGVLIRDSLGVETPLDLTTGYTVSGLNVYTVANYDNTNTVLLYRIMPFTRNVDNENGGEWDADQYDDEQDAIYMHLQELQEIFTRNLYAKISETIVSLELPLLSELANNLLGFAADGTPIPAVGITAAVSTFMETVLDDTSAAAALETLGLTATAEEINRLCDDTLVTATNWDEMLSRLLPPLVPTPIHKSLIAAMSASVINGTADGNTENKLVYSTGGFTAAVNVGDIVYNDTDNTWCTCTAVDSNTQLSLDWDCFPDGTDDFIIYPEPTWPSNVAECDGSTVSDSDSPINGKDLPDLNGSGANDGRVLRGGGTAGILQASAMVDHKHQCSPLRPTHRTGNTGSTPSSYWYGNNDIAIDTTGPLDNGEGTPDVADENRMINMSAIYVMRFK